MFRDKSFIPIPLLVISELYAVIPCRCCLFEGGPPEELAGSFPILLEAMIALTLVDLL